MSLIAPTEPPREVRNAFRVFAADVVCGALGLVLALLAAPSFTRTVERAVPGLPADRAPTLAAAGVVVLSVLVLGFLVVELLLAFLMRRGSNWARVALTVLSTFWVLVFAFRSDELPDQFAHGPLMAAGAVLQIISFLLLLAAGSYMFRPAASQYFRTPHA